MGFDFAASADRVCGVEEFRSNMCGGFRACIFDGQNGSDDLVRRMDPTARFVDGDAGRVRLRSRTHRSNDTYQPGENSLPSHEAPPRAQPYTDLPILVTHVFGRKTGNLRSHG